MNKSYMERFYENTKEYETVVYNEKKEVLFSNYKNVQSISIYTNVNSTPYEKSVLTYKENGKYGLINLEGKQITKPIYDEISLTPSGFSGHLYPTHTVDGENKV